MGDIVSVVIPVYNADKTLKRCLESVLNQTYKDLEVVVIDDGSKDMSGHICDEYAKKDSRIIVCHQENAGQVSTTKKGLELVSGKYVGFIDSDDYIETKMYEELLRIIKACDADYIHSDFFGENIIKNFHIKNCIDISIKSRREWYLNNMVLDVDTRLSSSKCTNLFKKEIIKEAYGKIPMEQNWAEDILTLISCALISDKVAFSEKAYYHFVYYPDSQSHKKGLERIKDAASWYESAQDMLREYGFFQQTERKLKEYYFETVKQLLERDIRNTDYFSNTYCFSDINCLKGKRNIVYGAGKVGKDMYYFLKRQEETEVVAWIDAEYDKKSFDYCKVKSPDVIEEMIFDYIVIAIKSKIIAQEIKKELIEKYDVDHKKVIWLEPKKIVKELFND